MWMWRSMERDRKPREGVSSAVVGGSSTFLYTFAICDFAVFVTLKKLCELMYICHAA